ncbi:unnamed protein product [Sphagnum balticum]
MKMQSVTKGELSVDMKAKKILRIKVRFKGALHNSHDGFKLKSFVGTISARARNLAMCICVSLLLPTLGVNSGESQNAVVVRYSILFKLRQLWLRIKGSNYSLKKMKKEENRDGNFSTPVREIHSSSKWSKVPRSNIFSKSQWKNSNPENGTGNGMKNIIFCRSNSSESAEKSSSSLGRFFSSWKIGGKQKVSKVQAKNVQEFYRQSVPVLAQDVGMVMTLVVLMQQTLCRSMPLFMIAVTAIAIVRTTIVLNLQKVLTTGIQQLWADAISIGGTSILPQARFGELPIKILRLMGVV